ncbi:MAG: WGR domain-containing protein [Candidatus Paracaedibacter sp.]
MDNLLNVRLKARTTDLGHDREYTIGLGKDLFQQWYVTISFGRSNASGTNRIAMFSLQEEALKFIHQRLRHRLSSPKRIGCSYQVVSFDGRDDVLSLVNKTIIERFSWFEREGL